MNPKLGKVIFILLAVYGGLSIVFSTFWIWIIYRPPSVGYAVPSAVDMFAAPINGNAHITKKEFYNHAWWATALSNLGGLLLITCAVIRNKYTSYGYFLYAIMAAYNCIIIFTLTVFFIVLALGSQGQLEWKIRDTNGVLHDNHQIQCGIETDFMSMYGSIISSDDWYKSQDKEYSKYLQLVPEDRRSKYHYCDGSYEGRLEEFSQVLYEFRAQDNRVLGISIWMILLGIFSLLLKVISITLAIIAWKNGGRPSNVQSRQQISQPTNLQTRDSRAYQPNLHQRSVTGHPITTQSYSGSQSQ